MAIQDMPKALTVLYLKLEALTSLTTVPSPHPSECVSAVDPALRLHMTDVTDVNALGNVTVPLPLPEAT